MDLFLAIVAFLLIFYGLLPALQHSDIVMMSAAGVGLIVDGAIYVFLKHRNCSSSESTGDRPLPLLGH